MREVTIYSSWQEFLEILDLSYWRLSDAEDDVVVREISIEEFLDQPDIFYEVLESLSDGERYIHIFEDGDFQECIVRDEERKPFYVVYEKGRVEWICEGQVYFDRSFAEERAEELKEKN